MFKKNDNEKSRIILESFKKKLVIYEKENTNLTHKLQDYQQTLELKYEILSKTFISIGGKEELITEKINNAKSLFEKYNNLLQKRKEYDKKIYTLRKNIEENTIDNYKEINDYIIQNELLNNEKNNKDKEIKQLKEDLQKWRNKAFYKKSNREIIVCPPTKNGLEKYQEYKMINDIFIKVNNFNSEKEIVVKELKEKGNLLYKKMVKEAEDKNIILSNLKDYNFEEEEFEDEESSSEDEESFTKKSEGLKITEKLNKEYNELKNEYKEYEKKLNKYKENYWHLKEEIENLKKNSMKKKMII